MGCAGLPEPSGADRVPETASFRIHGQHGLPAASEQQCAWFGEPDAGVLYFGQSAFWSALRSSDGDPRAVLETHGPRRIGRFDLANERMLDPLDLSPLLETRSGVWDVLPIGGRQGRVYFTTYFDSAGVIDLQSREVTRFREAGAFLNELAVGPEPGQMLVTRYADSRNGGGAVLVLDADGAVARALPLRAPAGQALAAKSVAWDPVAREIWVTTDRLPIDPIERAQGGFAHPTLVLSPDGTEIARFGSEDDSTEVQFMRFSPDGHGAIARVRAGKLELVMLTPETKRRVPTATRPILLDAAFPASLDFAQDIQLAADGTVVVTRWSGRIHRVDRARQLETIDLPRSPNSLYYTAVASMTRAIGADEGNAPDTTPAARLCATRCDTVEVVCTDLAPQR